MKIIAIILVAFLFPSFASNAQPDADTTVNINVAGACAMCKDRIEEAAKGRGVKGAKWNAQTQKLILTYNPSETNTGKVEQRIAAAGHDTENEKAKDAVYKSLPECCYYREINSKKEATMSGDGKADQPAPADKIRGVVLEEDDKGNFNPMEGVNVVWMHTAKGVTTNSSGFFEIAPDETTHQLILSYSGFRTDTISVLNNQDIKILLASNGELKEVKVTSRQRSTYLSMTSPLRTQIMSERELLKAACCNLSESFETNPSVDVSFTDAVTGSKQIQLLGLSGNYTQLTVENMPGPRGLATPMGLNSIAGPWVESIQLTKGIGSVANGFESIAGQINVELKKPENMERLYFNGYLNDMGKTDLNLLLSQKLGAKWSTALLLHDAFLNSSHVDYNKDGFRDMPTGNLFSAVNRWKYDDGKGFMMQLGIKFLDDKRTGGQTHFRGKEDRYSLHAYGLGIYTRRYEGFAKIGYVFPQKKFKSIGLQLSAFQHEQDSYFGLKSYDGEQQNFYANLIYQSIISSTAHKFRTGLSFLHDSYDENLEATNYQRKEKVPGAFFEYTFTPVSKFDVVAGIRTDHNNLYGWFATPRLHVRYEPVKGTVIRLSAGKGQRTANILAENSGILVSNRELQIMGDGNKKAFGLDAEVAWNKGVSIDQKLRLFNRPATFSVDFFRNDFTKQAVLDMEDPAKAIFYNLDGKSFSNSLQGELAFEPLPKLEWRLAYRFFDVRTQYGNALLQKPFTAKHRFFTNLAYEIKGWKMDYTLNFNGTKRIPSTASNPEQYRLPQQSPEYFLMNAQVSKSFGGKFPFDIYAGGENLTNFFQKNAVIAADDPFGPYFDGSMVWGPVGGRLLYTGVRFKIK